MAQGTDTKLYVALGVLAVLGGGYYLQQQNAKKEVAEHSVQAEAKALPALSVSEEETKKVDKIVIEKPAKKEGEEQSEAMTIVLVKEGDTWKVDQPVKALANQKNVESLLENLTKLEAKEQVSSDKASYEKYGVSDEAALHSTFYEGDKVVRAIWAGKSGGRGQMARVDGAEGVFTLEGYSGFLYSRDVKNWRDLSVLELDIEEATEVAIENEHGEFSFEKKDKVWSGKFKKAKAPVGVAIKDFEPKTVTDLLNAYKKLSASGFGDDKSLAETSLENPLAKLTVTLAGDKKVTVEFGDNAEGSSKWAKLPEGQQIYSISSWAADWAFAEEKKFQKKPEGEGGEDDDGHGMPGGLPPGMQMPGMPGGHP